MGMHRRNDNTLIKLKLKRFGTRAAILKALEEVDELQTELETMLQIWDSGCEPRLLAQTVANVAEEYADVSIAVYDTFKRVWVDSFPSIVEKKRRLVYEHRLPMLVEGELDEEA